jgi:cyanophycinase
LQYPDCGAIALVGSGEYLPVMTALEGELLQAAVVRGKREAFVQLPTAAGQEDSSSLERWHTLGQTQGQRLAVETHSLRLYTREDAFNPDFVEAIQDAGLIYLSGGDPNYLAETLIDTPVWESIVTAWSTGSSLMGCSAGAMVMGSEIIAFRKSHATRGLGLFPMMQTIPHYDRFLGWLPDRVSAAIMRVEKGMNLIGIDEKTALVRDRGDAPWRVWGEGKVHLLKSTETHSYVAGEEITFS